jgi:uncharacterized protein YgbK (DUF1537 family)
LSKVTQIEISVEKVLNSARRETEINRVSDLANASISEGNDVVVYTSRHLFTATDKLESLRVGQKISQALVDVVRKIEEEAAWLIAKGGITSSDVATKGLNIERAQSLVKQYLAYPFGIREKKAAGQEWYMSSFQATLVVSAL